MNKDNKNISKIITICIIIFAILVGAFQYFFNNTVENIYEEYNVEGLDIDYDFLTPNPYSRNEKSLETVNGIVVHYTANPGTSAKANRNYFNNLKDTKETSASSHFIIDMDGSIIQCIPLNEIAFATKNRNIDTISIECCHPDDTGKFTDETYESLQRLTKALMKTYKLNKKDIIRHYDVTGKMCPKYYVEHPEEWENFINSL